MRKHKILVVDVAASSGGAMTVLNSFAQEALSCKEINWVFVLSGDYVLPADNVTAKIYSWVKKSRLHRMYFDYFVAPKIVREESPDCVLSLQNINIPFVKTKRVTYVHQSIPFCNFKFCLKENPVEWLYQNVVSHFIYSSIRRSDLVVVQTKWMRTAVVEKTGIPEQRIMVIAPEVELVSGSSCAEESKLFFYPAAYAPYKNHKLIISAVAILESAGVTDFEVLFTLSPEELPFEISTQRIRCCGRMPYEQVLANYAKSVLLFPSLLETVGLPLMEAAAVGSPILAAQRLYACEVLEGYPNVLFFDPYDPAALAELMKKQLSNKFSWKETRGWIEQKKGEMGWDSLISYIKNIK